MLGRFWREWIYDSTYLPIDWKTHPHCVHRPVARFASAALGSIVPAGFVLLQSGVLSKLDDGTMKVGWVFWATTILSIVIWVIAAISAATSYEKTLMRHVFFGSVAPANLTILYLIFQIPE